MYRNLLNIHVVHTIEENVNSGTSSSNKAQVFFVSDPDKKLDIIPFLENSLQNMKNLVENIKNKEPLLRNEKSEVEFHKALYDNDVDYARLARYIINCLVGRGLLVEENHDGEDSTYWRTDKLKTLCPEILKYTLPVIDPIVDEYDSRHQ
jgi:predicted transcriptional regulator